MIKPSSQDLFPSSENRIYCETHYKPFPKQNYITVSQKGKTVFILREDIICIKSESNYSFIHLKNGTSIFTSKTLKYWCDKLQHPDFIRVHNSFLINKNEIVSIEKKNAFIVMSNGLHASYSRTFKPKTLMNNNFKIIKINRK